MTTVVKPKSKVNVELLNETLAYIETHPEDWDQRSYRCGSGMCFAGWACVLAGGEWVSETPVGAYRDALVAEPGEPGVYRGVVMAHDRAKRLLGLSDYQAGLLFNGGNLLGDLRRIVAELTA